jgi:2-hydroxymethylglutarate dehydrogenase
MNKKVAFIGLGAMGRPMAANIAKADYSLKVFDLVPAFVQELVALGATAVDKPRQAALGSDIVLMSLPNAAIVANVVAGENGILEGSHPGQIIIDLSSVTPEHTQKMAALAKDKGVEYLDAPVSGGVSGAAAGTLTIMVGGDKAAFTEGETILRVIGKKIYHVGAAGAGDTLKLVNNLMLGVNMAAAAEALTLGVKAGLDPRMMLEVIGMSSGRSYAFEAKVPNFILKGNFEPGFAIDLQYKDLEMATQTAKAMGVPLLLTNVAQQIYETAKASGLGRKDISAVTTVLEKLVGVEVREGDDAGSTRGGKA